MKSSLTAVATETLTLLKQGGFRATDGRWVSFAEEQSLAEAQSFVLTPEAGAQLLNAQAAQSQGGPPSITVTAERTQEAARRLVEDEGQENLVALNFASARSPGGGFLRGAKAQEEDLARCSGLYPCLIDQTAYYEANKTQRSLVYTDHLIYAPRIPWFRTHSYDLLDRYFTCSVITAPAPNAGEVLRRDPKAGPNIESALRHRAGLILALARAQGHRDLLLGAWGCGVFGNEPYTVADAFGAWLESETFAGAFDHVCFAIFDRNDHALRAFEARFR